MVLDDYVWQIFPGSVLIWRPTIIIFANFFSGSMLICVSTLIWKSRVGKYSSLLKMRWSITRIGKQGVSKLDAGEASVFLFHCNVPFFVKTKVFPKFLKHFRINSQLEFYTTIHENNSGKIPKLWWGPTLVICTYVLGILAGRDILAVASVWWGTWNYKCEKIIKCD